MPLPSVPREEQLGEHVVADTSHMADARQTEHASEPGVARGPQPDRDRAIGADMKAAIGVDRMQATADIVDARTEMPERIWLDIDVAKFYGAGTRGADQAVGLPVDAGVTDRAFRVVPDGQARQRLHDSHRLTEEKQMAFRSL